MYKLRLVVFGLALTFKAVSQNLFPSSGNVGIGTSSPVSLLHITGDAPILTLHSNSASNTFIDFRPYQRSAPSSRIIGAESSAANKGQLEFWTKDGAELQRRMLIDHNGSVGINRVPSFTLDVAGGFRVRNDVENGGSYTTLRIQDGQTLEHGLEIDFFGDPLRPADHNTYYAGFGGGAIVNVNAKPLVLGTANQPRMFISGSGLLGVGTNAPEYKLSVQHDDGIADGEHFISDFRRPGNDAQMLIGYRANGSSITGNLLRSANYLPLILGTTSANKAMIILNNGNVGLGIDNPVDKLSVNGNISARKVTVRTSGWSDYVFDEGFVLTPLPEVHRFIRTHKHLPDVPSAKEVEEKGISVGDNQALLLKKIEEITLYLIEQEKKIAYLMKENQKLKKAKK